MSPRNDDDDDNNGAMRQNTYDDQDQSMEPAYRTASPPVPTLKNKDKKQKSNVRHSPTDDYSQQQPPVYSDNDDYGQPLMDDNDGQSRQSHRKQQTPRQTGLIHCLLKAFSCYFLLLLLLQIRCTRIAKETSS
jgi:hypothetical protein